MGPNVRQEKIDLLRLADIDLLAHSSARMLAVRGDVSGPQRESDDGSAEVTTTDPSLNLHHQAE
jgi:hypothetical protein